MTHGSMKQLLKYLESRMYSYVNTSGTFFYQSISNQNKMNSPRIETYEKQNSVLHMHLAIFIPFIYDHNIDTWLVVQADILNITKYLMITCQWFMG